MLLMRVLPVEGVALWGERGIGVVNHLAVSGGIQNVVIATTFHIILL